MRIAQVVPLHIAVPPAGYGGTERVVHNLTEALVSRGHEVTLFATGDSRTSARLIPVVEHGIFFDPEVEWTALHMTELERVYRRAHHFDVIHSHLDYLTLPYISRTATPTIITLHGRLDRPEFEQIFHANAGATYVSISDSQRRAIPNINWVATVHHGIDVSSFPFSPRHGKYLLFVGRMSPEKRCDMAIAIARRAGVPLKIAAKIDHKERPYFERVIRPLLDDPRNDPPIEFLGEKNEEEKRELLRDALALLLPIDWPEPFGMVFIEALACGTPVLTRPCGSVPELLEDGVTGYIAEDEETLAAAVGRLDRISRFACRTFAEQRFDRQRMAAAYERVYERALGRQQPQPRAPLFAVRRQSELAPGTLVGESPTRPVAAQ